MERLETFYAEKIRNGEVIGEFFEMNRDFWYTVFFKDVRAIERNWVHETGLFEAV